MEEQVDTQGGMEQVSGNSGEFASQSNVGNYGNNPSDWRANLPADLQTVVSRFNDVESLVKSYRDAQSVLGKKVEAFGQQDWQAYQNIMSQLTNIPTSPEGYQIETTMPNGGEGYLAPEDSDQVTGLAYELGLNNEQAQEMHDVINDYAASIAQQDMEQAGQALEYSIQELEKAWGNAGPTKVRAVDNAINNILPKMCGESPDSLKEQFIQAQVWNSPAVMKILAAIGELGMDSTSRGYNNIAPMDAQSRFNYLRNDPDFMKARIDPHHPNHEQAKAEFAAVCAAANGGM
jgi:hypothetical protein